MSNLKNEKKKLKEMNWNDRLWYLWAYYKIPLIAGLFILFIFCLDFVYFSFLRSFLIIAVVCLLPFTDHIDIRKFKVCNIRIKHVVCRC